MNTFKTLPIGTEIYYTGDVCNPHGFGTVTKHREPSRFSDGGVDLVLEDGRELRAIQLSQFDASPGRRFIVRTEWQADRDAKIAEMRAYYEKFAAKV